MRSDVCLKFKNAYWIYISMAKATQVSRGKEGGLIIWDNT